MVRNEAKNIADVIDVAREATDTFVLADTGSGDDTIRVAQLFCEEHNLKLFAYQDEWFNYSHNRCVALDHAYKHGDWVLQLSGDEYLHDGHRLGELIERLEAREQTACQLRLRSGLYETCSPRLVKSRAGWIWEGRIHEVTRHLDRVQTPVPRSMGDPWIEHRESDPVRKQARYPKDLEILLGECAIPAQDCRNQFYLGWTLEALGRWEDALHAYDLRLFSSSNPEEEWFTRYRRAFCLEKCGRAWAEVQDAHLKNYATRPWRAEPLCDIAMHWISVGNWELALLFARTGSSIPYPKDESGIVMHDVYAWRLADIVAESALKCRGTSSFCADELKTGAECAKKVGARFPGDPRVMMYCAQYKALGFDVPVVAG